VRLEKMKRFSIIIIILLFVSFGLRAELRFTANANKTTVIESENFQVSFSVNGDGGKFNPPNFAPFKVLQGPSTSQSVQIINGSYSKSQSYTYLIQAPAKKGNYIINAATIDANGKQLQSNQIKITVAEMSTAQKAQKDQEQKTEQNLQSNAEKVIDKNLFVKVNVDKSSAYIGEPIIVRYKLYRNPQLSIAKLDLDKVPVFNGFWIKDLRDSTPVQWKEEIVNGARFLTAEIRSFILIPQQTGKLLTDALEFKSVCRLEVGNGRRSNDFFDNFFRNNSYKDFPRIIKSPQVQINVSETRSPKPTEYRDLLGQYTLETTLDRSKTKTNEPVTLKLTLKGNGNLNFFEPPKLNLPSDLESYDPKIKDDISYTQAGISGTRTIEYLIIPRNAGKFTIPAIELPYFDLRKRDYITLKGGEYEITVEQGKNEGGVVSKSKSQMVNRDINDIKTNLGSNGFSQRLFGSGLFWAMLLLPALFIIAIIIWKRKQEEESGNIAGMKNKAASKVAIKRLKMAKLHLDKQQKDEFYEEITKALWGYLSDKFTIPVSDLTKEKVRTKLDNINYLELDKEELIAVIDESELARFSPTNMADAMPRIYTKASEAIIKLESFVKG